MTSAARTGGMAGAERAARDRRGAAARGARRSRTPDEVMEAAAAFLSVRPRSVAETRGRLRHLGYPATLVDAVVERLIEFGYLDDVAFARWWVESRDRARPRGAWRSARAAPQGRAPRGRRRGPRRARRSVCGPAAPRVTAGAQVRRRRAEARAPAPRSSARRPFGREADPRRRRQRAYALLARHGFTPGRLPRGIGRHQRVPTSSPTRTAELAEATV